MPRSEIRVAGFGGQGVILSGMIIGRAASIYGGRHATLIQAFGPEARGSACSVQVTVADEVVAYPYVKHPDIFMVMSPDACKLFAPQVKPGGLVLHESGFVPADAIPAGLRACGIPAARFAEEMEKRMVMNIIMVGFFARVTQLLAYEAFQQAVRDSVPRGTEELNLQAFQKGHAYGEELLGATQGTPP